MFLQIRFFTQFVFTFCIIVFTASASAARLDILFVYDQEVVDSGWSPAVVSHSWIEEGNIIFANSNVDLQLEHVGIYEKTLDFSGLNNDGKLHALRLNPDVLAERDRTHADIVVLITSDYLEGFCGWGFIALEERYAYSILKPYCGGITFTHELGHNLGLQHARRQFGAAGSGFISPHLDFGWGYGVDNSFATIMSYPEAFNATEYIPRFSDPNATCKGLPCGVPISSPDSAYAVAALNQIKETAAAFRVDGGASPGIGFDLPARIQAEDYAQASDSTVGNISPYPATACEYRGFDVDVANTADDGTCAIGWAEAFETVSYQIGDAGGVYDVTLRVATALTDRRMELTLNEARVGDVVVSGSDWNQFQDVVIQNVQIPSGAQLGVRWLDGGLNLNYLDVKVAGGTPPIDVGDPTVLPIVSDAYIRGGEYADSAFGDGQALVVMTGSANSTRRAVLRMDRQAFQSPVSEAVLRVRVRTAKTQIAEGYTIHIHAIRDDWSDSTVTWNHIGDLGSVVATAVTQAEGTWMEINITDVFNAELGQQYTSLALANPSSGRDTYWAIYSNESAHPPTLHITP